MFAAERLRQENCCALGGRRLTNALRCAVLTEGFPTPGESVACTRTWASVAGFQIIQPQLSAPGPASAFPSHVPAARTNSRPDPDRRAIPGEASREPSSPALPAAALGIRSTCEPDGASLSRVGSLAWGAQTGVSPPGRGEAHCPGWEPSVGFLLPRDSQSGKKSLGTLLPGCGVPQTL